MSQTPDVAAPPAPPEPTIAQVLGAQSVARPGARLRGALAKSGGIGPEDSIGAEDGISAAATGGNLQPIARQNMQLPPDAKCAICDGRLFGAIAGDGRTQVLKPIILSATLQQVCHVECLMPYHDEQLLRILFKIRTYSIGDTVAATPILRELRRRYPRAIINVLTCYPELWDHNPHLDGILDMRQPLTNELIAAHEYQLDAFNTERLHHFSTHSVEFSSICLFNQGMLPGDWDYEVHYPPAALEEAVAVAEAHGIDPANDQVILLHPHGTEWKTRDWGRLYMPDLARALRARYPQAKLVSIGGKRDAVAGRGMDNYVALPEEVGAIELYGKLGLLEAAAFMDLPCMKLLVTPDTGTLHLAASRPELPIVGIFTLIKGFVRTPVRHSRFGYKFRAINADDPCNCTYAPKSLTGSFNFSKCPRGTFIEELAAKDPVKIPLQMRVNALRWMDESVTAAPPDEAAWRAEVERLRARYAGPSLPCFPTIEKVMIACEELMRARP